MVKKILFAIGATHSDYVRIHELLVVALDGLRLQDISHLDQYLTGENNGISHAIDYYVGMLRNPKDGVDTIGAIFNLEVLYRYLAKTVIVDRN